MRPAFQANESSHRKTIRHSRPEYKHFCKVVSLRRRSTEEFCARSEMGSSRDRIMSCFPQKEKASVLMMGLAAAGKPLPLSHTSFVL